MGWWHVSIRPSTPCAHSCTQHNIRNSDTKRSFDSAVNASASAVVPLCLMPLPASPCALHVSEATALRHTRRGPTVPESWMYCSAGHLASAAASALTLFPSCVSARKGGRVRWWEGVAKQHTYSSERGDAGAYRQRLPWLAHMLQRCQCRCL